MGIPGHRPASARSACRRSHRRYATPLPRQPAGACARCRCTTRFDKSPLRRRYNAGQKQGGIRVLPTAMQQKARRAPDAPASAQRRVEAAVETRAPERAVPVTFRRATRLSVGRDQILNLVELLLDPLVLALSLWAVAWAIEGELGRHNVILSVIVFALTFPGSSRLTTTSWRVVRNIAMGWLTIFGLLLVFGWGSRYLQYFDRETLTAWFW